MKGVKHILILSSWYPSRNRPFLGNFIQRFAKLISSKYRVTVLYTCSDIALNKIEISENLKGNLREIIAYHPKGKTPFHTLYYQYKAFKKGLNIIQKVDIIHANVLLTKGIQFLIAKRKFKCPLLVLEHASYYRPEVKESRNIYEKMIFALVKPKIDQLAAVSELLKSDLKSDFPNKDIQVLPYHVDLTLFKPKKISADEKILHDNSHFKFIHISTLDETVKDPKGIIDACKLLINGGITNFHLTFISDEPYGKWETYAYSKKLTDYISFIGPLQWGELVPHYQESDAFILFSKYETFSIVLAEAWSCGIPVITTPVGIGKDLPAELGSQVEVNNPESLAKAMHRMIIRKREFDSVAIRKYANRFSPKNVLMTYDGILQKINIK
ncbi:MAG: glycosyltransferase family 4 protein [Flavobacteriia bacterium]|nr:glycosyltransferase family 4 protein [Flavobacteriia bacterium]